MRHALGTRIRRGAIPLALAAAAFVLALLQRPGWSSSDTKIDLHTRPSGLLADVAHLWTSTAGLGGVESAQYSGYLFPMGPFFAALHALGIADWVADRLWLGLILALGCWGVVRLGDVLFERERRGVAHAVAGAMYLLNPYVVVFANRTTVTLLAYAALPWLVLIAWRGVRARGRWPAAAAFALVLTASGPGVNVAVVAFVLLGPALLLLYELWLRVIAPRAVWGFAWRAGVASLAASLWWLVPAAAQGKYGIDFLKFTEPAGAIWSTTSLSESLRLMGYWVTYIGVGYGGVVQPYFSDAGTLLFAPLVVVATLMLPGLALGGFAWTRRAPYAPFLLGLVLLAAMLMTIGFPEGTLLRHGVTGAYNHLPSIRFLRTTYKAGPLLALGLAGLGGLAAALAAERLRGARRAAAAAGLAALLVLSAWPLFRGQAVDRDVTWKRIPAAWTAAAHDLDRTLPADKRALVLPGQLYSFYRWGGTVDPVLPSLTGRPVAIRTVTPYGDLHGTDLLWTTDARVQQDRLVPGQLRPLVKLLGAAELIAGTDDDYTRSAATDAASAARTLAAQGFGRPDKSFGPLRAFAAPGSAAPIRLPEVRTYRVAGARSAVELASDRPAAVVDGSADGLVAMAAFGPLPDGALEYAGDLTAPAIRAAARRGAPIVVSDSNRRRIVVISRMRQSYGRTLGATDAISEDAAVLNPFPAAGPAGQTVAVLHGARSIQAPFSPGYSQLPEHGPFAAFDGDPRTYWLADAALQPDRHWVEITFDKPLDINSIDVLPRGDAGAVPSELFVASRRIALRPGWNHVELRLHRAASLKLLVTARRSGSAASAGLAEVRIPGVHVTRSLRPPTLAESALAHTDLSRTPLTYLFERETGDAPYARRSTYGHQPTRLIHDPDQLEAARVRGAGDAEKQLDRVIAPPAARDWAFDGWAQGDARRRGCGAAFVTIGGRRIALRVMGPAAAGRPIRIAGCGKPAPLPAGPLRLRTSGALRVDLLRMRSPAPNPVTQPLSPGRVLDQGQSRRGGGRDGVRLALTGPGTLVFGQSWSRGWRAYCDGRSLGQPRVVDGYANGWTVRPPCHRVRFAFAPDGPVRMIQLLSGLACLLLLAIALWPAVRRRRVPREEGLPALQLGDSPMAGAPVRRALALAAATAAVLGFCFSLRAGVAIFFGVAAILWLGVGTRVLAAAAGVLLALVVPAVYLLFPATDRGGYNPGYAGEHIGAHWVAVAAYTLLVLALAQSLSTARRRPRGAAAAPAAADE